VNKPRDSSGYQAVKVLPRDDSDLPLCSPANHRASHTVHPVCYLPPKARTAALAMASVRPLPDMVCKLIKMYFLIVSGGKDDTSVAKLQLAIRYWVQIKLARGPIKAGKGLYIAKSSPKFQIRDN
jgi:hypothetical protein